MPDVSQTKGKVPEIPQICRLISAEGTIPMDMFMLALWPKT
jgi:hypothetical protein